MPIEITYLADMPDAAPTLAAWSYRTWHHFFPDLSEADLLAEYKAGCQKNAVPLALVAVDAGVVCGTASLVAQDGLPDYAHLTPWLASVYVADAHRRRGIGAQLVTRIIHCAWLMNIPKLYLWTDAEAAWYTHMGWNTLAAAIFHARPITIMAYSVR
jgi:N-acetylglutamate synthase-like GNAT family acetyltransferase